MNLNEYPRRVDRNGLTNPLFYLRPENYRDLLKSPDERLRSKGISWYIDNYPQVVICGDRSSGKSSILEAISGHAFPIEHTICTKFPIELTLRCGIEEPTRIKIKADPKRCIAEKLRLDSFRRSVYGSAIELKNIIRQAELFLGLRNTKHLIKDALCIEMCDPNQPHLTLVDLPGIFEAEGSDQSATDAEMVKDLVREYSKQGHTIMLVVIPVSKELQNERISNICKLVEAECIRTLMVITKPDTVPGISQNEEKYVEHVLSGRDKFGPGWHILRNRTCLECAFTLEERNMAERRFFGQDQWRFFDPNHLGAEALRVRLNKLLKDQLIVQLRKFATQLEGEIPMYRHMMLQLGPCRPSIEQQSSYLLRISSRYGNLIESALSGNYESAFFTNGTKIEITQRRLRAVIHNLNDSFAQSMRANGHAQEIVDGKEAGKGRAIHRGDFVDTIQQRLKDHGGIELPGTFGPGTIRALFEVYTAPWDAIVGEYERGIVEAAKRAIQEIVKYVSDKITAEGIMNYIQPSMTGLERSLHSRIMDIQYATKSYLTTYNPRFGHDMQKARSAAYEENLRQSLTPFLMMQDKNYIQAQLDTVIQTICKTIEEPSMERYASVQATYAMESYYQIILEQVIDNIIKLAVEHVFLGKLASLFDCSTVGDFDQATIRSIAEEDESSSNRRDRLIKEIDYAEDEIAEIRRFERSSAAEEQPSTADFTTIPTMPQGFANLSIGSNETNGTAFKAKQAMRKSIILQAKSSESVSSSSSSWTPTPPLQTRSTRANSVPSNSVPSNSSAAISSTPIQDLPPLPPLPDLPDSASQANSEFPSSVSMQHLQNLYDSFYEESSL